MDLHLYYTSIWGGLAIVLHVYIVLYTNLEVPCDCTTVLYWTIHLSEGILILYYTPLWRGVTIVQYCTIHLRLEHYWSTLYYTPAWGDLAIVLHCTIHLTEGALLLYYIVLYNNLREPCYCSTWYYTPTWGGLAIVVHCTIHLPEGALLLYYTVLYCTRHLPEGALLLSWWLEEEAGSPIFTSCPNCFTPSSVQIWN